MHLVITIHHRQTDLSCNKSLLMGWINSHQPSLHIINWLGLARGHAWVWFCFNTFELSYSKNLKRTLEECEVLRLLPTSARLRWRLLSCLGSQTVGQFTWGKNKIPFALLLTFFKLSCFHCSIWISSGVKCSHPLSPPSNPVQARTPWQFFYHLFDFKTPLARWLKRPWSYLKTPPPPTSCAQVLQWGLSLGLTPLPTTTFKPTSASVQSEAMSAVHFDPPVKKFSFLKLNWPFPFQAS